MYHVALHKANYMQLTTEANLEKGTANCENINLFTIFTAFC